MAEHLGLIVGRQLDLARETNTLLPREHSDIPGYNYTSHIQQTVHSQTWRKILAPSFKR
jgi:hypothetical protein